MVSPALGLRDDHAVILVDAQADAPVLAVGAIAGNEDTAVPFGNAITWTMPTMTARNGISQVTLSGFPAAGSSASRRMPPSP